MNKDLLKSHIDKFISDSEKDPAKHQQDVDERSQIANYYRRFTKDNILAMTDDDIYEYLSKLWAMQIWGNKHYVIDKVIEDNGLQNLKQKLTGLIWGDENITERWDSF